MKIDVSYHKLANYPKGFRNQWIWTYKPYTYVKGFIIRICGIYFNVTEENATEKLIKIWLSKMPS